METVWFFKVLLLRFVGQDWSSALPKARHFQQLNEDPSLSHTDCLWIVRFPVWLMRRHYSLLVQCVWGPVIPNPFGWLFSGRGQFVWVRAAQCWTLCRPLGLFSPYLGRARASHLCPASSVPWPPRALSIVFSLRQWAGAVFCSLHLFSISHESVLCWLMPSHLKTVASCILSVFWCLVFSVRRESLAPVIPSCSKADISIHILKTNVLWIFNLLWILLQAGVVK